MTRVYRSVIDHLSLFIASYRFQVEFSCNTSNYHHSLLLEYIDWNSDWFGPKVCNVTYKVELWLCDFLGFRDGSGEIRPIEFEYIYMLYLLGFIIVSFGSWCSHNENTNKRIRKAHCGIEGLLFGCSQSIIIIIITILIISVSILIVIILNININIK